MGFPIRDCRDVTISGSNVVKWCLRVFPVLSSCLSRQEVWTTEYARLEVDKCVRKFKLLSTVDDADTINATAPLPGPSSSTPEVGCRGRGATPSNIRELRYVLQQF